MAHGAASIKKIRDLEQTAVEEKEKERRRQRKTPRERIERKRKVVICPESDHNPFGFSFKITQDWNKTLKTDKSNSGYPTGIPRLYELYEESTRFEGNPFEVIDNYSNIVKLVFQGCTLVPPKKPLHTIDCKAWFDEDYAVVKKGLTKGAKAAFLDPESHDEASELSRNKLLYTKLLKAKKYKFSLKCWEEMLDIVKLKDSKMFLLMVSKRSGNSTEYSDSFIQPDDWVKCYSQVFSDPWVMDVSVLDSPWVISPPSEFELKLMLTDLKTVKAAGPDGLLQIFLNEILSGGPEYLLPL